MPVLFNTAFQYHVARFLRPEVEANYPYWPNGKHEGLNQLFLTPGLALGRLPVSGWVGLTLVVGTNFRMRLADFLPGLVILPHQVIHLLYLGRYPMRSARFS